MLWYSLMLEIRISGKLIPCVACAVALIAEQILASKLTAPAPAPALSS